MIPRSPPHLRPDGLQARLRKRNPKINVIDLLAQIDDYFRLLLSMNQLTQYSLASTTLASGRHTSGLLQRNTGVTQNKYALFFF
jgi:hypothetical protein